jgi:uncharacterized protein YuzE
MITKKRQFTVEQDYDFLGDSLLFNITEKYSYQKSVQFNDNIIIDFDENDVPVALELLNASKLLHVNKYSLTHPLGIDMCIEVGPESIRLEAKFSILIHQKPTPLSLHEQIANDVNLKSSEAHFARAIS